jgi:hypothetical protein
MRNRILAPLLRGYLNQKVEVGAHLNRDELPGTQAVCSRQLGERIEVIQQTGTLDQQSPVAGNDVTVIGGGLAGMAACVHLAKAGLRVLCVDAGGIENDAVGESLDWCAPCMSTAVN